MLSLRGLRAGLGRISRFSGAAAGLRQVASRVAANLPTSRTRSASERVTVTGAVYSRGA